jgi:hypothetical protein
VFLLGLGDAKAGDESWFTPAIRDAFRDSSELWLEVAPAEAATNQDSDAKAKAAVEYDKLSHEPDGRTFFDELEPQVRQRILAAMAKLAINKDAVETLRPWFAYYTINGAFWSRAKLPYEPVNLGHVLRKLATDQGKAVHYEMPDELTFARFMAAMPQAAQSQYIDWLLDFLEDFSTGDDKTAFDWETGSPSLNLRSLDRMRTKTPNLYQSMQVQRNGWWAHKIDELLATGGTSFIGIGELHVLGPDGIPSQLKRLRVVGSSGLRENPSV